MNAGAFFDGLMIALQWPGFGFLLLGVAFGIWLGAVPGLGGPLGIVLVLPFTYGMDSVSAFALLLGIFAVTSTSDTIASVMLGIPGTASAQATVLDGHPMARRGEAARAFGAAFTVSAFGGVFGAVILALSLPIALPIILRFNNPELFVLALLGLTMVGSLSGRSVSKGLAAAAFGLVLSCVGYAQDVAIPRYWMDSAYLLDKLPLIPVVLGIFALPELIDLSVRDTSISNRAPKSKNNWHQLGQGMADAVRNWWLALRCSAIGVYIGMIPGIGGAVVDWIAYGHALQSTKNPESYGTGDVRGVIAPEAANNAVRGGSLIPTVAFGVPGSAMNALLLSALLIQGLQPGAQMLTTQLPMTYSMVWNIVLANIIAAGLLMVMANHIAKLSFVSGHLIVPIVVLFVFMGAWLTMAELGDWISLLVFGALGYLMKRGGWPRPPVILAFILGGLMENSFLLSWKIHQGLGWVGRPIVLVILALIVLTLVASLRRAARKARAARGEEPEDFVSSHLDSDEDQDRFASLLIGLVLVAVFLAAAVPTFGWPAEVAAFPLIGIVPGVALSLLVLGREWFSSKAPRQLWRDFQSRRETRRALQLLLYLIATVVLALLIGQKLALLVLIATYLVKWGGYGWRLTIPYVAVCWAILTGFYDRIVHVFWMKPLLNDQIRAVLPDWLPAWVIL
ncbi:tripartite tricarboxylate transporter permease [Roseibium sp. MMSF_3544]|uniref:tripartite tricarboxylate transporter permease n=1 Tax=unclassified Roseibium TaxID=2629323 RepID=UPI00273EF9E9|nr:tripartite tricarboxylate transporter permease [Roseibium sp. MMSF_3544]